jgi:Zn-dependent peptidase ImmA (M78 family)/transcriptional regulator with XRE-family HTH domain
MAPDDAQEIDYVLLGGRLQHARKANGITQAQAAEALGVGRTTITAIEKGERRIKASELMRLAELYGRTVNELLSRADVDPSFSVQLRAAYIPNAVAGQQLSGQIDAFERMCQDYLQLEILRRAPMPMRYPPPYQISNGAPERDAEDVASAERHRLGLGDGPFINLRATLENDVGLRVFYMDLPSRVAAMFAFTRSLGGCVAINRNHPPERRRLSGAHEYAHLLTRRQLAEVSLLGRYRRVPEQERFADTFARAFLMPESGLRRRFNEIQRSRNTGATPADLCRLAHFYFVSLEAITLRLEELSLLRAGTWDRLTARGFHVREAQQLLDLPPHPRDEEMLPSRYLYLAAEAYDAGQISEGQFAQFLRTDRMEARRIAEELAVDVGLNSSGELSAVHLDLGVPVSDASRRSVEA